MSDPAVAHQPHVLVEDMVKEKAPGKTSVVESEVGVWSSFEICAFVNEIQHVDKYFSRTRKLLESRHQSPSRVVSRLSPKDLPELQSHQANLSNEKGTSLVPDSRAILDTGASRSVIGRHLVAPLLKSLPKHVRDRIRKVPSKVGFRFGNNHVAFSHEQLQIPFETVDKRIWLLIEVVSQKTPFLLSIHAMKFLGAQIDLEESSCYLKKLRKTLPLKESRNGLFLVDLKDLCDADVDEGNHCLKLEESCNSAEASQPKAEKLRSPPGLEEFLAEPNHAIQRSDSGNHAPDCRANHGESPSAHDHHDGPDEPSSPRCGDGSQHGKCESTPGTHRGSSSTRTEARRDCQSFADPFRINACGRWTTNRSHSGVQKVSYRSQGGGRVPSDSRSKFFRRSSECHGGKRCEGEVDWKAGHSESSIGNSAHSASCATGCTARCTDRSYSGHFEYLGNPTCNVGHQTSRQDVRRGVQFRSFVHQMANCPVRFVSAGDAEHGRVRTNPEGSRGSSCTATLSEHEFVVESLQEQKWMEAIRHVPQTHKSIDLLEVYADPDSRLCTAVQAMGGKAMRFTMQDGDLSTYQGQVKLLRLIKAVRPKHVWMSPECRPYCNWSRFNEMRSVSLHEKINADRQEARIHLELCSFVCKMQVREGRHFHMENPHGSEVWGTKTMKSVIERTIEAVCDQCTLGLRHPQTKEAMRKRTRVQTSSPFVATMLEKCQCKGDHHHAPIAGNCQVFGRTMAVSRFAAFYPRQFARKMAQAILDDIRSSELHLMEAFPTTEIDDRPTKKQKTQEKIEKENPENKQSLSELDAFVEKIRSLLPKSGSRKWTGRQQEICLEAQRFCPDFEVRQVIACKGVERFLTTDQPLPFRHSFALTRVSRKVVDLGKESWQSLTKTAQRRKAVPSHVLVCVFGKEFDREAPELPVKQSEVPETEAPDAEKPESQVEALPEGEKPTGWTPMPITTHGPGFLNLDEHRRGIVQKLHVNLGHPSPIPFANHLKEAGAAPEIVEAARDYVCPSCAELRPPKMSTPGHMREAAEFNQRVFLDGFEWKNGSGEKFYVLHLFDEATHFHLGQRTGRTCQATIRFLENVWTLWAGNPKEIVHDSAGEWITEEWKMFLRDEGIHNSMSAAPWQRGRIEKHGDLIKETLNRINSEQKIENERDFDIALRHAFQAKNSLANKGGFSPEQAVLGNAIRVPGSISQDEGLMTHVASEEPGSQVFQRKMEIRQKARKAFLAADNDQAIRRAMLRKSRGLVQAWQCGQLCMYWDRRKAPNMLERGRWCGPARIVFHESRTIVWITHMNRLLRCAHENLRPVTFREYEGYRFQLPSEDRERLENLAKSLQQKLREKSGMFQFSVLTEIETAPDDKAVSNQGIPQQPEEEPKRHISPENEDSPDVETPMAPEVLQPENDRGPEAPEPDATEPFASADTVPTPDQNSEVSDALIHNACYVEGNEAEVFVLGDHESLWDHQDPVSHQVCQLEFEMPWQKFERYRKNPRVHSAYIASAAKKAHAEVQYRDLDQEEKKRFDAAKGKEIKCWLDTSTVRAILRNKIHPSRIMSSRWILTWKRDDNAPGGQKAKARLVVRGFQDPEVGQIDTESPTLSRDSRMLLFQTVSSKGWQIQNFDITTAFLRGRSDGRELAMEPPEELRIAMKMSKDEVCLLEGNAYGRVDAPILFYKEFRKQLEQIGFEAHPLDECLFLLRNSRNRDQLDGILGIHVDDGIGGGNEHYEAALERLQQVLPFGSREFGRFRFTGLEVEQMPDNSIKISQEDYAHKIDPIDISKERRKDSSLQASEHEGTLLRGLCGSLQYASVNTRPDIAAKVSLLQKGIPKATVGTLMEGNKVLKEAKEFSKTAIFVRPLPMNEIRFASFGDASFASESKLKAQQGVLIVACTSALAENEVSEFSPMSWNSKQIGRVVRSTLSAEAYAMSMSLDKMTWIRCMWEFIKSPNFEWSKPEKSLRETPKGLLITDCKSLYDLITKMAVPNCQEWRTTIEVRLIREQIDGNAQCRWVSTAIMLADALTKAMDSTFLRNVLALGRFKIYDEQRALQENANKKFANRWIAKQWSFSKI